MGGDVVSGASWGDIAKQQGVAWMLLVMIVAGMGFGFKMVYESVPEILNTINMGYEKNSEELAKSAEIFRESATENRKMLKCFVDDSKDERLRDQRLMVELIRRGDLTSEVVTKSMEAAAAAVPVRSHDDE